jgi:uncharacterized RDD family membrane protein YckC
VELAEGRQGHYAGAVSRLVAFGIDVIALWFLYSLGFAGVTLAVQLVTGHSVKVSSNQIVALISLVVWSFLYFAYQWSLSGKTIGMALLGVQVVAADGTPVGTRSSAIRTLTLPISLICLGLGCLGILTGRERRGWHDHFARTCVVYSWDARAARLRWLARRDTVPRGTGEPPGS